MGHFYGRFVIVIIHRNVNIYLVVTVSCLPIVRTLARDRSRLGVEWMVKRRYLGCLLVDKVELLFLTIHAAGRMFYVTFNYVQRFFFQYFVKMLHVSNIHNFERIVHISDIYHFSQYSVIKSTTNVL